MNEQDLKEYHSWLVFMFVLSCIFFFTALYILINQVVGMVTWVD